MSDRRAGAPSERVALRRAPHEGADDRPTIDAILDAGVVPVEQRHGAPVPAPDLRSGVPLSPSVARLTRGER